MLSHRPSESDRALPKSIISVMYPSKLRLSRLHCGQVPLPMDATVIGYVEDTASVFCSPSPLSRVVWLANPSMTYAVLSPCSQSCVVLPPVMLMGKVPTGEAG